MRVRVRKGVAHPVARLGVNAPRVLEDRRGVDAAGDGATVVDLLLGVGLGLGLGLGLGFGVWGWGWGWG